MAKKVIISTPQNDPSGTPLDEAFTMCNDNFSEIYNTNIMDGGVNVADVKLQVGGTGIPTLTQVDPGSSYTVGLEYDGIDLQRLGTGMKVTVATTTGGGPVITDPGKGYVDGTTITLENRDSPSPATYTYSEGGSGSITEYTMTITNGIITKFSEDPK
tara:strand:+ start:2564 stop:3037 length:474 start_codon:yes stop_codon:yes gene_type:complete